MALPFVSASSGLRSETKNGIKRSRDSSRIMNVGTAAYTGTFPANPIYGSVEVHGAGCGTALTEVENFLTGVCFTDGTKSERFSCSKHSLSLSVFLFTYFLLFVCSIIIRYLRGL
jgi:hypothetical protein